MRNNTKKKIGKIGEEEEEGEAMEKKTNRNEDWFYLPVMKS